MGCFLLFKNVEVGGVWPPRKDRMMASETIFLEQLFESKTEELGLAMEARLMHKELYDHWEREVRQISSDLAAIKKRMNKSVEKTFTEHPKIWFWRT